MSKYVKLLGMAVALMAATTMPVAAATAADDTVIAIVNGDKILKKDIMEALSKLPVKKDVELEKIYPFVVDQIINEKLIDTETAKSKIEDTDEYKKRLDVIKVQLVKQLYLENSLKDKISDKAVKAEYEKFKKENKGKEEVHARHILVPTEEEAKQVVKDLEAGQKFEELASKRSSGPTAQNGGDVGYFAKDEMLPAFSEAAFKLKKGEYSKEPVKTEFGWHVIKVEDKRDRAVPEMKEVEMAIRNKLGQDALQKLVEDLKAKADIKRFKLDGSPAEEAQKN